MLASFFHSRTGPCNPAVSRHGLLGMVEKRVHNTALVFPLPPPTFPPPSPTRCCNVWTTVLCSKITPTKLAFPSYFFCAHMSLCVNSFSLIPGQTWKTQVLKNQVKWSTEDHQIKILNFKYHSFNSLPVSLPSIIDFYWQVDASDSVAGMAVPTCLVQMKVSTLQPTLDVVLSLLLHNYYLYHHKSPTQVLLLYLSTTISPLSLSFFPPPSHLSSFFFFISSGTRCCTMYLLYTTDGVS